MRLALRMELMLVKLKMLNKLDSKKTKNKRNLKQLTVYMSCCFMLQKFVGFLICLLFLRKI